MAVGTQDSFDTYGSGYQYSNGDSEDDFIKKNAFSKNSGYGLAYFANPALAMVSGIRGKAAYKRARAQYEAMLEQRQTAQRASDYANEVQGINQTQGLEEKQRMAALGQTEGQDDAITGEANQMYDAQVGNSLANLRQQYQQEGRSQGLAAARRGVMGGSNDFEQQAALNSGYQSNIMGATQNALQNKNNVLQQRQSSLSALRKAMLSGDPNAAAAYQSQAQSQDIAANQSSQQYDYQRAMQSLRGDQYNNASMAIGGALGGLAQNYRNQQQANNYGVNSYGAGAANSQGHLYGYGNIQGPPSPEYDKYYNGNG